MAALDVCHSHILCPRLSVALAAEILHLISPYHGSEFSGKPRNCPAKTRVVEGIDWQQLTNDLEPSETPSVFGFLLVKCGISMYLCCLFVLTK